MDRSKVAPESIDADVRNEADYDDEAEEEDCKMPAKPSSLALGHNSEMSSGTEIIQECVMLDRDENADFPGAVNGDHCSNVKVASIASPSLGLASSESASDEKARLRDGHAGIACRPGAWSIRPGDVDWCDNKDDTLMDSSRVARNNLADCCHEKETLQMESGLQHDMVHCETDVLESGLVQGDPDMVYGEYGGSQEDGIAVAFSVSDDVDYIPSALEFDPDAKAVSPRSSVWSRPVVTSLAVVLVLAVAFVVGWWYLFPGTTKSDALPERATVGIAESIAQFLNTFGVEPQLLEDPTHPYRQALDWIQTVDGMALTPLSAKLIQRYLAAYFYYSTSRLQPWNSGCDPLSRSPLVPTTTKDSTDCILSYAGVLWPEEPMKVAAKRWLSSDDECLWAGVTCDKSGNLCSLDLGGSSTTGTFPEGIAGFPFLRSVSLSYGALTGTLPAIIGGMKHLVRLELGDNQFSGPIPEKWYQSRSLQAIYIQKNKLTGTLSAHIGNLKDTKEWYANDNGLVGSIPRSLGNLQSLDTINLASNQLTGPIPTSIGNVNHWLQMFLSRNKLTGSIPTEIGLSVLAFYIELDSNRLNGTIPTELSNLSLWELDFSDNQLSGSILPLVNMTSLTSIRIQNNQFSGELPAQLGSLKLLYQLTASGNNFTGAVSKAICNRVAPKNTPGSSKVLATLQLDCAVPSSGGVAEISCPVDCCTQCCDADGMNCRDVS